jgi:hypothetical protein
VVSYPAKEKDGGPVKSPKRRMREVRLAGTGLLGRASALPPDSILPAAPILTVKRGSRDVKRKTTNPIRF